LIEENLDEDFFEAKLFFGEFATNAMAILYARLSSAGRNSPLPKFAPQKKNQKTKSNQIKKIS
jgi:hypothetical protein